MLRISRNGQDVAPPAPNARGSVIVTEHTGAPATYRVQNTVRRTITLSKSRTCATTGNGSRRCR
jgi:hypothetical protein